VPEIEGWVNVWDGLGADPTTVAGDEIYSALQQGVADAQENPIPNILSLGLNEVQSHLMTTRHLIATGWMNINIDVWESMSEDDRQLLESELSERVQALGEENAAGYEDGLQQIRDAGLTVVEIDRDLWLSEATPVLEDLFSQNWTGSLDAARSV
jgi:TRAP-type C4-dicarboxylate transport system substrate-binding protein